jgi:hypothetical protein
MGEFLRERLPDPIDYFSSEGLTLTGKGKWRSTACRFHGGSDSMRINTTSGAWMCMNCSARGGDVLAHHMAEHGMDFIAAANALGAWNNDGKPSKKQRPKPIPATAAIQVLAFESTIAAVAAGNLAQGIELTEDDRARLYVAARRIQHVAEVFA